MTGSDPSDCYTDITLADARKLAEKIKKRGGVSLQAVQDNLVDLVWKDDKPRRPKQRVSVQDVKFAGKPFQEKLEDLRKELEKRKAAAFVICRTD